MTSEKPKTADPWPSYLTRSCEAFREGPGPVVPSFEDLPALALRFGANLRLQMGTTSKTNLGTFNLVAGLSCPGQTQACADICNVLRSRLNLAGRYHTHNLLRALWYELRGDERGLVTELTLLLRPWQTYRLHGSGDLFSQFYVDAWTEVFRRARRTTGFGYTRSFEFDMSRLASLPNFTLWASVDVDNFLTAIPWSFQTGAKRAYMSLELAQSLGVDPTFQCPEQTDRRPDCASCGACFAPNLKTKRSMVGFDVHSAPSTMLTYYRERGTEVTL